MKNVLWIVLILFIHSRIQAFAQNSRKDKGLMVEPKNEFMDSIKKTIEQFNRKDEPSKKSFKLDFGPIKAPLSPAEFTQYWHNPPISQGLTNTCWSFSTTSFLESEIYRLTRRKLKLSEMYTVYWEYVEKTRRFIRERGNSAFAEGSESNAVTRIWKQYGAVPEESYTGLKPEQVFHDHSAMFEEMKSHLQSVKASNNWSEDAAVATIRSILNHYLGEPPTFVVVDGKKLTPKEYLEKIARLNPDDYVAILSLKEKPFHQYVEYETEDNWWHSKDYYNVPLDEFIAVLKRAALSGYTICLGGDVSEAGVDGHAGLAVVPTFDIPSAYIDDNAREFRFNNGTTVDDHGIHLVGFKELDGNDWYLIKDSGSGSRNNGHPGYYFYNEDFVKLKMIDFMAHKDAARQLFE